jgi:hypothetical protein
MTAPISAFKGIHDLGYVFTRMGAAGNSGFQQDWIGFGANLGAGAGKFMWYLKDKFPSLVEKMKTTHQGPTPTYLIDIAIVATAGMDLLNGFGAPTKAECLDTGKEQLENVNLQLTLALPDKDKWSGGSAKTYGDKVTALQKLVQDMKELDATAQTSLQSQASSVQLAHTICAVTGLSLVAAQGIALALYFIPGDGPMLSWFWQVAAVGAASAALLAGEGTTVDASITNGGDLEDLANEYDAIAERAKKAMQSGTFAQIVVPGAQESTVGRFEAISTGMSGPAAMPAIRSLASSADGRAVGDERALLSALTDDGETPGETPETPAWTPPTPAQVTAMSGQLAKLSGHLSQHMNLVNQTTGQIQQLASMAQQGQKAAAPAEEAAAKEAAPEEAALADDVEGAGAGVATEGAERAPVQVAAAGAEEAQEPSPVERIL